MKKETKEHIEYLKKIGFGKHLKKITKKLKDKKIVLYGAGSFFKVIYDNYDLSGLNIVGISDAKFEKHECDEEFCGYKVLSPGEMKDLNPDYILVSTLRFVRIIENFYADLFESTKIKIKPLINKPFFEIWREFRS